jgi:hypothetical protein
MKPLVLVEHAIRASNAAYGVWTSGQEVGSRGIVRVARSIRVTRAANLCIRRSGGASYGNEFRQRARFPFSSWFYANYACVVPAAPKTYANSL